MHDRLKIAILAGLLCMCSAVFAQTYDYLGVSYKYRSMLGHDAQNYDMRQVLPRFYNGGEVYYTHRFDNDVGIYLGYEQSHNQTQTHTFGFDEEFLGPPQPLGSTSYTSTTIRAVQLDMVGFIDFLKHFEAVGQFGFSMMQADMHGTITNAGVITNMDPSKGWCFVPRLSLGMLYFILKGHVGLRLMGDWEGTNLYRMKLTDDDGLQSRVRPFRESWCFSLGILVRFKGIA